MYIYKPSISLKDNSVVWNAKVTLNEHERVIWYSVHKEYEGMVSERLDAALVALLIPSMKSGEDLYLDGTVSERLYYHVLRPLQAVLQEMYPSLNAINVIAKDVQPADADADGVVTGFSGGIDSFSVLADHHYSDSVPPNFRLTHLLFNNVGAHGRGGESLFRERFERVRPVADRIGLPLIPVNSNVHSFCDSISFRKVHTLCNTSVALFLQNGIRKFMYGSTFSYSEVSVKEYKDISLCDPIILPLLSTERMDTMSVGSSYTRPEKTIRVSEIDDAFDKLTVCVDDSTPGINCSKCFKCSRTLLTLEIAGSIQKFADSFDLDVYYEHRNKYIAWVLKSDDPFSSEIREFSRSFDFEVPISSRVVSKTGTVKNWLLWPLRKSRRMFFD